MNSNGPIGVFDSGLGGLTVVKALMNHLPDEQVVYFGDTARVPYGTKSREAIIRFSKENVDVLRRHRVKMVVVACNSSSSHALPTLKRSFDLPIMGVIGPGVRRAVQITRNRRIGVIATPATINSGAYVRAVERLDPAIEVVEQACPLFVPLVEEGWFEDDVTAAVARKYLHSLQEAGVDTLILGCTHYPLLTPVLAGVMGTGVMLVDSAERVALEVKAALGPDGRNRSRRSKAHYRFLVSDDPEHFQKLAQRFLGRRVENVERVRME